MNADNIIPSVVPKICLQNQKVPEHFVCIFVSRQEAFWTNVCEPTFEGSFFFSPPPNNIRTLWVSWKPWFVKWVIVRDAEVIFLWQIRTVFKVVSH